eukprot:352129-Chlamydomonas_euryale.AAC.2
MHGSSRAAGTTGMSFWVTVVGTQDTLLEVRCVCCLCRTAAVRGCHVPENETVGSAKRQFSS